MEPIILKHMNRIIDDHVHVENLNILLKSFIMEKQQEIRCWSNITLCTHNMLGGTSPDIYRIAAATELAILSSDIIDDLQDQDHENKAWMKCAPAYSLNAVLLYLMGFIGEIGQCRVKQHVLVEISKIITRSINGQQRDLNNEAATVDDYLVMVKEKSGSIFRLAIYMGFCSLEYSDEQVEQMHDLADCIGIIHQIQNDIRDITRFDLKSDLLIKKRTLPIIYLLSVQSESFRQVKSYYEGELSSDVLLEKKDEFLQFINDSGCIEYAKIVQSVCAQKAEELFASIQAHSPWKEKFREITYASFV